MTPFEEKLTTLIEIIIGEADKKYTEIFGEKKLWNYFNILSKYIILDIREVDIKIKKSDETVRSIMLKDSKFFQ